ncbi:hypothetical protein V6N13_100348 [Hibiscus sabdariffa]|uniref:Uncharacterized protein n=2 Tax=Hibiscus sabdariffa TaxID=183260 RepID=A0ABR2BGJ3_9ROSI
MVMEECEKSIEVRAMEALGKGFDISGDFRLKYAKGTRLVVLDETIKRDIVLPGAFTLKDVPQHIRLDKGDRIRFKSDVLEFNQSEMANLKSTNSGVAEICGIE